MATIDKLSPIERELHRLGCLPLNGQYGYGQAIWGVRRLDDDPGVVRIDDGQEEAYADEEALVLLLGDLDPEDDDLFERIWRAIQSAEVGAD